jgi:hypothetical protein
MQACSSTGSSARVAIELPLLIFGFMPLPSIGLRTAASFFLCMYGVIVETG